MHTKRTLSLALLGVFVLSGCGSVYVRSRGTVRARAGVRVTVPERVEVRTAPPPLRARVQVRPARPGPNAVWVDGHYKWQGRWVWIDGHWETDRPGMVWVAPVATRERGRVVYHPGYWCPADEQPAPAYRQPGAVRVSVRPSRGRARATGATVRVREGSSGSSGRSVRVRGSSRGTSASGGSVRVREGSRGRTSASGGSVRVREGSSGRTSASGGSARVRGSSGGRSASGGSTRVRGSSGGRSGGAGRSSASGGSVGTRSGRSSASGGTVRGRGEVNRGDDSVGRPSRGSVRVQGGSARRPSTGRSATSAGGSAQRPSTGRSATSAGGSARRPDTPRSSGVAGGSARVRPSRVEGRGADDPDRPGANDRRMALRCSISTSTAPRNGLITVTGTQFSSRARVQIGGRYGVIRNREAQRLRVQVPGSSSGGQVRVIDGDRSATCGRLTVR